MLSPNKTKYRYCRKGGKSINGVATSGDKVSFGSIGLKATESGRLNSRQIESARKVIARTLSRDGKLWIVTFPHTPFSKKPAEVRMGNGKGDVEGYMAIIRPGRVLFEVDGVDESIAISALRKASAKLPIKTDLTFFN